MPATAPAWWFASSAARAPVPGRKPGGLRHREARNPGSRLSVELAHAELEHEPLCAGLQLVDTPGIGSIHSHNTEVARDFLPPVSTRPCVLDAGQPLSQAERELFLEATRRVPRLLIAVNKIDHLEPKTDPRPSSSCAQRCATCSSR